MTPAVHKCPGRCGALVPAHHLACKPCWFRLPRDLRDAVTRAYQRRGTHPREHRTALAAAFVWYRDDAANIAALAARRAVQAGGA